MFCKKKWSIAFPVLITNPPSSSFISSTFCKAEMEGHTGSRCPGTRLPEISTAESDHTNGCDSHSASPAPISPQAPSRKPCSATNLCSSASSRFSISTYWIAVGCRGSKTLLGNPFCLTAGSDYRWFYFPRDQCSRINRFPTASNRLIWIWVRILRASVNRWSLTMWPILEWHRDGSDCTTNQVSRSLLRTFPGRDRRENCVIDRGWIFLWALRKFLAQCPRTGSRKDRGCPVL